MSALGGVSGPEAALGGAFTAIVGLLVYFFRLLFQGTLVHVREVEYLRAALAESQAQNTKLIEASRVTQDFLGAIEALAGERRP